MYLVFTIAVGLVIGLIDALPMYLKKRGKEECLSAFLHYVVVTFIIFNVSLSQLGFNEFVAGPLLSLLMALPVAVMVSKEERKAVPVILVSAVVLGLVISIIKHFSLLWFA
ncbi:MAG: hypothetical protein K2F53_02170 [Rikenellaceae bacterium]|nr:hypothetical protein [Rikenellaceae bacterium]MDE7134993.1 hypothetical protein [Rikenellaceae bacterium]MDE7355257.1 hypothetical protein [Rikenellaceae bacterium]